jgi:hypothetical protein
MSKKPILRVVIILLIVLKCLVVIFSLARHYLKTHDKTMTKIYEKISYYKYDVDFVFIIGMSLLIMYLFAPPFKSNAPLEYEIKVLLFAYAIIIILTANWSQYFQTSVILNNIKTLKDKH